MARIFIESRPAAFDGNVLDHLYLVYQDAAGDEFVIRGGPQFASSSDFGNIVTEPGVPIYLSSDIRSYDHDHNPNTPLIPVDHDFDPETPSIVITPGERGQREITLGERDAEDVWNIMLQQAQDINNAGIDYELSSQNSNSVIASILHAVGLDIEDWIPTNTSTLELFGEGNLLDFDRSLNGTSGEDTIVGYMGDDTLSGNGDDDSLSGNAGNDSLDGGSGNDTLDGGEDDDLLTGGAGNDVLKGGAGNDTYNFSGTFGSDQIIDSDGQGAIIINGTTITGEAQWVDGAEWELHLGGSTFGFTQGGGGLGITPAGGGGSVNIQGFSDGNFGLTLSPTMPGGNGSGGGGTGGDVDPDIIDAEDDFDEATATATPLVIDLDSDGFHFTDIAGGSPAHFDLKGNGFAVNTSWNEMGDGFLARDLNGNGRIDNITELFGGNGGTSAWDKLAALDTNSSGTITSADTAFSSLRVWQDADGDGYTDSGELKTLAQLGITSITLQQNSNTATIDGQEVVGNATVTMNGNSHGMTDVIFTTDKLNTWYVGDGSAASTAVDSDTFSLPLSRGYGTLPALALCHDPEHRFEGRGVRYCESG